MSQGIHNSFVKEMYQRMTDEELKRIATQDGQGLTPDAIGIVKEEIARRGIDSNITKGIAAQNREYTIEEIDVYCTILSKLECPYCGNFADKLAATQTMEVWSAVIITSYDRKMKVGCPNCLDKENNKALTKSVLLGWWGLPWGIVRTVQSVYVNIRNKKKNHSYEHNDFFRSFALSNVGQIEAYKNNKQALQEMIAVQNKS